MVILLDPSAGQQVWLVGQPRVIQVLESQEQEQDGGDDLAGDALQHGRPTGQLHQDTQADYAHLAVVETAAQKCSQLVALPEPHIPFYFKYRYEHIHFFHIFQYQFLTNLSMLSSRTQCV